MTTTSHPESVIRLSNGREVQLKVHQCLWSGTYPANSLAAIDECYQERVARVEIDVCMLRDADFLVVHELDLEDSTDGSGMVGDVTRQDAKALHLLHEGRPTSHVPPLLSEVVELIRTQAHPSQMELDLKERRPLPWPRVEELVRIVQPVKERITLAGVADWNLRRILQVDPSMPVGWDPARHFDWPPQGDEPRRLPRGAYGYFDAHPLAAERWQPTNEYVMDRLSELLLLVPGLRELHLRLTTFEHMLDDGVANAADFLHRQGVLLDVWTLDAGTPRWSERLRRALDAGVDIVTTNTPRVMATSL